MRNTYINIIYYAIYIMITSLPNKDALLKEITESKNIIVLKFGAEWCAPCKLIHQVVHDWYDKMPETVTTGIIDVDEDFELFAHLKSKKIVPALPTILRYNPDNTTIIPDDCVLGIDQKQIDDFFQSIMDDA